MLMGIGNNIRSEFTKSVYGAIEPIRIGFSVVGQNRDPVIELEDKRSMSKIV
jgi:hypothetical protein